MGNTVRIRNGMSNATEGDILGSMGDIVKTLGVVDLAGGHLLVTADIPTGMTVQVAGGIVYVPNSNYDELDSDTPKFYPVVCDSEVVTIDNNVSGSTRIDIVCVKVDKAIAPDADASNIATKVVIKGTPGGGTPSTPANHYKLAEITVVNGETAIENSMITDKRGQVIFDERYTKLTTSTPTDLTGYLYGNGSKVETKGVEDDWKPAGETWTQTSANTYTISGDKRGKYQIGDKIKLTQTTVKYFRITGISYSSPNTTVSVDGMALYTLASAAITSPYYSRAENPLGFPQREVVLSSGGGTLSETAAHFRRLLINYSADGRHSSVEILSPNNKSISLHLGHRSSTEIYISYGNFLISGTSISYQDGYRYWRNTSNATAFQWTSQSIAIGEVVGYRW